MDRPLLPTVSPRLASRIAAAYGRQVGASERLPPIWDHGALRIKLLGPLVIARAGALLPLKRRKSAALLVYLLLTGRTHSRETLAALLSGDVSDASARSHLRNLLDDLRDFVGDYLLITGETLAFDATLPHSTDLDLLCRAAEPGATSEQIDYAVAQHSGELLAGFAVPGAPAFDEWLGQERETARELHIRVLARQMELRIARDDRAGAIGSGRELLRLDPWREATHRQLMLLLARDGQRAAAVAHYEHLRRTLLTELRVSPDPATSALRERIVLGPTIPPHNLPTPPGLFFGRTEEGAILRDRLAEPGCRLLTILGVGGVGKTRLALEAAARYTREPLLPDDQPFPDGVFFVGLDPSEGATPLAPDSAAEGTLATLFLHTLGIVPGVAVDPASLLVAWCRPKRLLLVVDAAEYALPARRLLQRLVEHAPDIKLLLTSRRAMHLPDEWLLELPGLALPTAPEMLEQAPAGQLLLHLLQRTQDRPLDAEMRGTLVALCAQSGGIPLVLTLIGRHSGGLPLAHVDARVAADGGVLGLCDREAPPRQQSFGAILDEAWATLSPAEQRTLRDLAVFRGPLDLAALSALDRTAPIHLPALVSCALLTTIDRERFALPEPIRQYAARKLAEDLPALAAARQRHATHFAALAGRHALVLLGDPAALGRLAVDIIEFEAAWEWACDHADLESLALLREALAIWYDVQGLFALWEARTSAGIARVRAALDDDGARAGVRDLLARLLIDLACARSRLGNFDAALLSLEQARAVARELYSVALEGYVDYFHGLLLFQQGAPYAAEQQLASALVLARAETENRLQGNILALLGRLAFTRGERIEARAFYERALSLYAAAGDRASAAGPTIRLGLLFLHDDAERATELLADGLELAQAFGHRRLERVGLTATALYRDLPLGQHTAAEAALGRAIALAEAIGDRDGAELSRAGLALSATLRGALSRARTLIESWDDPEGAGARTEGEILALTTRGLLALYRGDPRAAWDAAREAALQAQSSGAQLAEMLARLITAHAAVALHRRQDALGTYRTILGSAPASDPHPLRIAARAGLAAVLLDGGDGAGALDVVAPMVERLLAGWAFCGVIEAHTTLLTARVLAAAADPRAAQLLESAGAQLSAQSAQLLDPLERREYLEDVVAHRDLLDAWLQQRIERESALPTDHPPAPRT